MSESAPRLPRSQPQPADSPALAALTEALQQRFGGALEGIILYGSCLRHGDFLEGVVDLYAVVTDYRSAYSGRGLRIANALLPPNVFFLEVPCGRARVRCKCAVLNLAGFRRGVRFAFESYFWGRFAQPYQVVYARSHERRRELEEIALDAAESLLLAALPAISREGTLQQLWREALTLSYATELRSERSERAGELAGQSHAYLRSLTLALRSRLREHLELEWSAVHGEWVYRSAPTRWAAAAAPGLWWLRRVEGKSLSVLRLSKGLFTFEGALDYIAWKLERHSGQAIEIPDKVRRRPLVHGWGLFWKLYRRGVFR